MPNYRRAYVRGATYFFTVVTYERHPIFRDERAVALLRDSFESVRLAYPFIVDSVVALPDHLHCIWRLPENDADFSERWRRIKARFSRKYAESTWGNISESMHRKKEKGIWQRRFWEHLIRNQEDLNRHRDYIHYNPVKHKLVDSPRKWKHSSFQRFVERGFYPEEWGQTPQDEVMKMDLE